MNHNDIVRQSFKKQAEKFVAYHMSKVEYTDYLIQKIAATGEEHALEVAAGTCICGRALAPYVKDITCLDMTEEMLAQGIRLAEESHIENIYFQSGNAEKLPYEPETFDLVITRLSFHHFDNPEKPFEEMKRVLKKMFNHYVHIRLEKYKTLEMERLCGKQKEFFDKYVNHTNPLFTEKDLISESQKAYDAFIVGSDQVWRKRMTRQIGLKNYFFYFLPRIKISRIFVQVCPVILSQISGLFCARSTKLPTPPRKFSILS